VRLWITSGNTWCATGWRSSNSRCVPVLQNKAECQLCIQLELLSFTVIMLRYRRHCAAHSLIPNLELHRSEMYLTLPRRLEEHWLRLGGLLLRHLLESHHLHLQTGVGSLLGDPLACLVSQISSWRSSATDRRMSCTSVLLLNEGEFR
jgi:hypothetical protein